MLLRQNNVCLNLWDAAPEFTLLDQHGTDVSLSDFKGKQNVVLAFNPGVLNESCQDYLHFHEEHISDFEALDAQVLGINMDSVERNKEWDDEIGGLSFPLLSDHAPLGRTTLKYDCFVPKEGYGKRALFVIDKDGIIRYIDVLKGERGACPNMSSLLDVLQSLEE
jgi:peroxiredoxin